MASRLSPGGVYWGDLTHVWCPVPESMQVFCRSSGLQWLGAHENIGASSELKGRLRSLAWGEVGSGYCQHGRNRTARIAFALEPHPFVCC